MPMFKYEHKKEKVDEESEEEGKEEDKEKDENKDDEKVLGRLEQQRRLTMHMHLVRVKGDESDEMPTPPLKRSRTE